MRASIVVTSLLVNILNTVSASPALRERFPPSVRETAAADHRTLILCTPEFVVQGPFLAAPSL